MRAHDPRLPPGYSRVSAVEPLGVGTDVFSTAASGRGEAPSTAAAYTPHHPPPPLPPSGSDYITVAQVNKMAGGGGGGAVSSGDPSAAPGYLKAGIGPVATTAAAESQSLSPPGARSGYVHHQTLLSGKQQQPSKVSESFRQVSGRLLSN